MITQTKMRATKTQVRCARITHARVTGQVTTARDLLTGSNTSSLTSRGTGTLSPAGGVRSGALRLFRLPTLTLTGHLDVSLSTRVGAPISGRPTASRRPTGHTHHSTQLVETATDKEKEHHMNGVSMKITNNITGEYRLFAFECHTPENLASIITGTTAQLPEAHSIDAIDVT